MSPEISSSLIGLGGSIIGGLGNIITNNQNVQAQKEINSQQLAFAREQTEREFDYNSISSQMKRAMEAGVNPMLLAGSNPASASAASVPSLDSPVRQNPFAYVPQASMGIANNILHAKQLQLSDKQINNEIAKTTVASYQAKIDLLRTLSQTLGDKEMTSSEVQQLFNTIFPSDKVDIPKLVRDDTVVRELSDRIRQSKVDTETKEYLQGWLDEFTNTQYMFATGQVDLQSSQQALNKAMANKENEKVKEIEQAIANMKEQFKVLEYQGKLSEEQAKYIKETVESTVKLLQSEAGVKENEASYWVWQQLLENPQSFSFGVGPLKFSGKGGYVAPVKQNGGSTPSNIVHPLQ